MALPVNCGASGAQPWHSVARAASGNTFSRQRAGSFGLTGGLWKNQAP